MSADRWSICPRCKRDAEKAKDELRLKAGKAYGKKTPAEYLEMLREAETPVELDQTWREDYWQATDEDGFYQVEYAGRCNTCGLEHKFKHSQQLDLDSPRVAKTR